MRKAVSFLLLFVLMCAVLLVSCSTDGPGATTDTTIGSDTETDPGTGTEVETESGSEPETATESESVPETETESESENETESEFGSETEAESETEVETETSPYPVHRLTIAGVDIADFTIVTASDLPHGYADFISYCVGELARATGVTLPVIGESGSAEHEIILGATDRDTERVIAAREQIQYDGYALVVDGGDLYITDRSGSGVGIAYGMAAFLEDYAGVTAYTSYYTVYHEIDVSEVPADLCIVSNPSFEGRNVDYYDIEHRQANGHIRVFLGNNCDGGYLDSLGGGIFSVAGGGKRGHTIGELSETGGALAPMPCLTDETIYQTVLKNLRARLAEAPDARSISVSVSDGVSHNCTCENCRAIEEQYGAASGLIIYFCNRLANDIREEYPNVLIETLAYDYVRDAPTGIKAADNVAVRICTDSCCFTHAITDPDCPRNAEFRENFEKWEAVCDDLLLWDYPNNFAGPSVPDPSIFVQLENLRYFKAHHVIEYFGEGCDTSPSGEFDDLMAYLLAKILWNADMTDEEYDALIDRAIEDMYGNAAPIVKEYLVKRDIATSEAGHTAIYTDMRNFYRMIDENGDQTTDTTFLLEMYDLWLSALEVEGLTEGQQSNLERSSIHVYMCVSKLVKKKKIFLPAQNAYRELCEKYGVVMY